MKLFNNVEVSGIERIVFNRATVYELVDKDEDFAGMWARTKSARSTDSPKLISHQQMSRNVSCICNTDGYRVWVHGDTINIYSHQYEQKLKCGCGAIGCLRHCD